MDVPAALNASEDVGPKHLERAAGPDLSGVFFSAISANSGAHGHPTIGFGIHRVGFERCNNSYRLIPNRMLNPFAAVNAAHVHTQHLNPGLGI